MVDSLPYPLPAGNTLDTPGSQAEIDCRNSSLHTGHSDFPQNLLCIHSDHCLCTGVKEIPQDDSHTLWKKGKRVHDREKKEVYFLLIQNDINKADCTSIVSRYFKTGPNDENLNG